MSDVITKVVDAIVPTEFQKYIQEKTAELSAFWRAGVVNADAEFTALANGAGILVPMPFWQDLTGTEQILQEATALERKKITAAQDQAVIQMRGDAWAVSDLVGKVVGSDPLQAIINRVGDYWARRHQAQLLSTLTGVFAAGSMSSSVHDIRQTSGASDADNWLTGLTFIDAKGKLGDAESKLTAIAMHSDVERSLRKQSLIDDVPGPDGRTIIKVFQGLEVIVDDGMPTGSLDTKATYTTYLFGRGAIAFGEADADSPIMAGHGNWYVEFGRDHLAGVTDMVNRKRVILHPRGVAYTKTSQVLNEGPTNAELETSSNWLRKYERKNIRLVQILHNISS